MHRPIHPFLPVFCLDCLFASHEDSTSLLPVLCVWPLLPHDSAVHQLMEEGRARCCCCYVGLLTHLACFCLFYHGASDRVGISWVVGWDWMSPAPDLAMVLLISQSDLRKPSDTAHGAYPVPESRLPPCCCSNPTPPTQFSFHPIPCALIGLCCVCQCLQATASSSSSLSKQTPPCTFVRRWHCCGPASGCPMRG